MEFLTDAQKVNVNFHVAGKKPIVMMLNPDTTKHGFPGVIFKRMLMSCANVNVNNSSAYPPNGEASSLILLTAKTENFEAMNMIVKYGARFPGETNSKGEDIVEVVT